MNKTHMDQELYDRKYLYGILVSATMKIQHKTIIKYENSLDGILAWQELKEEFEYDGSKELRLEQLENQIQKPYTGNIPMASFIDKFQATMAELEVISPDEYLNSKKKCILLTVVRSASGVSHLIQNCRDNQHMTYDQCARYLRTNSILIDSHQAEKTPARLMYTEKDHQPPQEYTDLDKAAHMFHTMAQENGL